MSGGGSAERGGRGQQSGGGSAERGGRGQQSGGGSAERGGRGQQSGGGGDPAPMAPVEQRVAALEALLTERGLVPAGFIEEVTRRYETEIGPMNGAKVVARAWSDPAYRQRLLTDGTAAIAEIGFGGAEGEHMVVVENTPAVHNVVVCTLCSCYPWPTLGLPPAWYKDPPYRARMVREPRALLAEMGCEVPEDVEIRVWDSSAEVRYLVLPQRPPGTEGMPEAELAGLVTRDSMIGVARL
jgi:nitrile hydratase